MSAPYPQQEPQTKGGLAAQDAGYPPPAQPYPAQPQGGYPPQAGHPPQAGYPPQPQGAYPGQPQGAYPQAQGYDQQQPPPYQPSAYPPQGQQPYYSQDQQNVVVVQQPQTSFVTADVHPQRRPELGLGAAIFAIISTIFIASFGCWWALPCTVVGIILGITSSLSGDSGNISSAKTQCSVSIACTVGGVIFAIVGAVAIIVAIIAVLVGASNNNINN